ncbi:dihydrodipicolinate synthase family protein [Thermosipho atlanticus]|uniref:4-hydroxy-tetrahydrodipicolinate synthase n=1 Tax=Thermosipho atlanticus DSM 15807 TaxID=1123380 RepID=A0A1M5RBI4_9BACT|nr:dihydrodipicolinate synthase family protein [Thermosipho atlanticus]SHH23665.1 4-hydroxy-tetrahydrodipicolinate synthase [Thermosipho atlanticus DSM 15807]
MNFNDIRGVIPAIITVFDEEGKIDETKFRNFIEYLTNKVHGLFVCGTYGSGPIMTLKERKKTLEIVVEQVNGRIPVIVHVGATSPEDIFELTVHAKAVGATAVASVSPFYYKYKQENIIRFFNEFVSKVDIPVFIYNNPKTTGIEIEIETVKKLKEIGLVGIKDSTFDLSYFYRMKSEVGFDDFIYVSGSEAFIIPTISLGASAIISGLANVFPEIVVELYEATINKDYEKAFKLLEKVNVLRQIQHFTDSIPGIHAMLELRGIDSGFPKKPFTKASDEVVKKIKFALENLDVKL